MMLEIIATSLEDAIVVERSGADRLELSQLYRKGDSHPVWDSKKR